MGETPRAGVMTRDEMWAEVERLQEERNEWEAEARRLKAIALSDRAEIKRWQENYQALAGQFDAREAEIERLQEALHRIHRGDPQPWKIAGDALTGGEVERDG